MSKFYGIPKNSKQDERDYKISRLKPNTPYIKGNTKLPKKFQYDIPAVKNQNGGSCTPHAVEFAMRVINNIQSKDYIDLSPGYIYWNRTGDGSNQGIDVGPACQILKDKGVCENKYWPRCYDYKYNPLTDENNKILYEDKDGNQTTDMKDSSGRNNKMLFSDEIYSPLFPEKTKEEKDEALAIANEMAPYYKITSYASLPLYDDNNQVLPYTTVVQEIKDALYNISPVVYATYLYSPAWLDSRTKEPYVYDLFAYDSISQDGAHSMCIYGWDDDEAVFLVANSWGSGNNNGLIKVKYTNFQRSIYHPKMEQTKTVLYYLYTITDHIYPIKTNEFKVIKIGYDETDYWNTSKFYIKGINTLCYIDETGQEQRFSLNQLNDRQRFLYIDDEKYSYGGGVVRPVRINGETYIPHQILNRFCCTIEQGNNILYVYKDGNILELNACTNRVKFNNKYLNIKTSLININYELGWYPTEDSSLYGSSFVGPARSIMIPLSLIAKLFNYKLEYDKETGWSTLTKK